MSSTNLLLQGHQNQILSIKYNPSGSILASGGMDRNIFLWSSSNQYQNTSILKSHTNAITSLCFSFSDILFTSSADKTVGAWNIQQQKLLRKYKDHNGVVHCVTVPKQNTDILASVGDDNIVRVFDQRSKYLVFQYKTKYPLTTCTFSHTGNKLYIGGIDNQIKIINIQSQQIQQILQGHQDTVSSLEISPDGTFLMSNSFDQTIKIWDIRSSTINQNRYVKTLSGHLQSNQKNLIRGNWSHDGLYVACGSVDKNVYIWDVNTKKIVQRLGGHTGTVNQADMTYFNKKSHLATCSNDKNIIVSELPDIFL